MKSIVIAAGYATRLYPLTEHFPKPLLQVGENCILGRLIADIDQIEDINEHIIVSNHKFVHYFEEWAKKIKTVHPVRILDDGTESNETRLGAVKDLLLAIDFYTIDEDILVAAADNILDFSFKGFVEEYKRKAFSMIMCYYEPDIKALQRTGVISIDGNMKVLEMQEKPKVPISNWAVPPFYLYRQEDLPIIKDCMNHGCGFDAPGNLAHYLCDVTTLYAWPMPGKRYDIGSLDSYREVQGLFK